MHRHSLTAAACAALAAAHAVHADTDISIDLTADSAGQFIDYVSNVYAQVGLSPDGMYTIGTTNQVGAPVNTFNDGDWAAVGTLTLDADPTGVGVETFSVTAGDFDFNQYADGSVLSPSFGSYSTSLNVTSGSIEFTDGVVTDINLDSDISFTFDALTGIPFNGSFDITNGNFQLLVDQTKSTLFGSVRQAWKFQGTAASPTVVPEPSSLALGIGGFIVLRRRR